MSFVPLSTFETFWQSRQQQILSSTPLIGNATYTSSSFDSLASPQASMVSAQVFADQVGTLYMDVSMDNTNWNYNQFSISVSANTATVMPWQNPIDRYYRFRYVNGATAQGTFRLSTSSTNNAGVQNVNASIVGSLANDGLVSPAEGGTALYNETNWDRQRGNTQTTLLASAARTATVDSALQTNYNAKGCCVVLNVTVASGTGGLTLQIIGQNADGSNYIAMTAAAVITTVTAAAYELYPGATGVSGQIVLRSSGALPRKYKVRVVHGDATNYNYSVNINTEV